MGGVGVQAMAKPSREQKERYAWYHFAIIYALDIGFFCDSNGDGYGDFRGAESKLDYLVDLGITCLWITPICRTPDRDNGYDIEDYYALDPQLGTFADFQHFCAAAHERYLRLMFDVVCHHTSDTHPWFQASRRDPGSIYRNYYIWSDDPKPEAEPIVWSGDEPGTVWTFDPIARAYFRHQFYEFEPDLATGHPDVRAEILRILDFWLAMHADAFRIDAASHYGDWSDGHKLIKGSPNPVLKEMRSFVDARRPDAPVALMGETDASPDKLASFFGGGDELQMLLNFLLDNYLMLALARKQAEPIEEVLKLLPDKPPSGQWANFVRNLDELDLDQLTDAEREEVYHAFAPDPGMRIYNRGIRRRLAPMLGGDQRRIAQTYSLLLTLPGAPVLIYGDEIGMGDDLALPERKSVRTPMQWSAEANAGFSTAPMECLPHIAIDRGPFTYQQINVAAQQANKQSLLNRIRRMIHVRRRCPEFAVGKCTVLDQPDTAVLATHSATDDGICIALHNLGDQSTTVTLDLPNDLVAGWREVLCDQDYPPPDTDGDSHRFALDGYGYRWFRSGDNTPVLI